MGETVTLVAADQHTLTAFISSPKEKVRGTIIVVQEIFGVNSHIREVTERFASAGYLAIAPALFDRVRPGIELKYNPDGVSTGRNLKTKVDGVSELDIKAAIDYSKEKGKIAVVGFCWGGSLAWRVASTNGTEISSAVSYYGGDLPALSQSTAQCPVMAHFGERDASIPLSEAKKFAAAQPKVETYFYDADHGFNCDQRDQFNADASRLAWERTQKFLEKNIL